MSVASSMAPPAGFAIPGCLVATAVRVGRGVTTGRVPPSSEPDPQE
jgi:hypothetical protein